MKQIDTKDIDNLPGVKLNDEDTFSFQCHSKLGCFNKCCRNLNLFLYPYDVIRLKNRLSISSDSFIDKHVDIVLRKSSFFPDVLLSMADNAEKTCPFLTDAGCSVYTDRPDACRSFPLEVGIMYGNNSQEKRAVHFFRPPEFCLGQNEKTTWTAKTWTKDQEAVMYNKMTTLWSQLKSRFQTNPWGKEGPQGRKGKMAFMATYNIDKFRSFILNSTFLKRYGLNRSLLKKVKTDDRELMLIGFEWVKLFIWGEQSSFIKPIG